MQAVKERIVSSVAEHVEAEVSLLMQETTTDTDISAYSNFSKQIRSKSADIPLLFPPTKAILSFLPTEK